MCSTNPDNWVTFDEDPTFESAQKSRTLPLENQGVCRPNGLQLNLSGLKGFPGVSPCTSSTPLSSPCVDFYFSPGPPSNSPLSTPTKDFPGFPGLPKAGTHVLYPIPECSSNSPLATSGPDSSLPPTQPTCPPHALSPSDHSRAPPTLQAGLLDAPSPRRAHSEALQLQHVREDCAFSNPFWRDEARGSQFPSDPPSSRKAFSSRDKEVPAEQKSLNQCSLSYVCERLEHLQASKNEEPPGAASTQGLATEASASSFVPHALFRGQPAAGWPFLLRIPEKKNVMSSRQWGPIFLKVLSGGLLQMYYEQGLEKPFKELQLDPHCRLSEPKVESFTVARKIHTVKIERVSYSERRKYHAKTEVVREPDIEQVLKLGSTDYRDFLAFLTTAQEELTKLPAAASKTKKSYEEQEIYLEVVDHFWGKVSKEDGKLVDSAVVTQVCCLCFVNGTADCFLTLNDLELQKRDERRPGKESEKPGIEILDYHLHTCVKAEEFQRSRVIKFAPLDACRFELMRFTTPYKGDDLPFSVKSLVAVQGAYVELQAFVNMTPAGQRPSSGGSLRVWDNVTIHFPVPAQWIKALWTMNLHRQKSLRAKMNRPACLGSLHEPESEPVVQVTVGSAKYESAYRAVVWKIDRLPDKNSSSDHPHCLSYKLELGSDQEIPSDWDPLATVQFSVAEACASGTEVRCLGVESDVQPQKHILQRACYNIQVEIEKKWIKIDGEDPDKAGGCVAQ